MKKFLSLFAVSAFLPVLAMAAGDYDSITAAADWGDVTTAVVAIGALLAAVFVIIRGTRIVLGMIKR